MLIDFFITISTLVVVEVFLCVPKLNDSVKNKVFINILKVDKWTKLFLSLES